MAKVDVFNLKREKVGELELSDEVFGAEVKQHLFHEVITAQLASRRQGTHAAKERAAVAGSSKKIYKQKGTGARATARSAHRCSWAAAGLTRRSRRTSAIARRAACASAPCARRSACWSRKGG